MLDFARQLLCAERFFLFKGGALPRIDPDHRFRAGALAVPHPGCENPLGILPDDAGSVPLVLTQY